ncbi:MAG: SAM-dependent DNA methyltransferase, partial [Clostridiales bacterium]|nr:SAM-dependent DNA methyltransferase [Clostridiales bacterium]
VVVDYEDIKAKKLSFSAGQYFEVKIEHIEMTPEEFAEKMADFSLRLESLFAEGRELESKIKKVLGELHYD